MFIFNSFRILFCILSELTLCQNDFSRPDISSAQFCYQSRVHTSTRLNKTGFINFQLLLCPHKAINSHFILKLAELLIFKTLWTLRGSPAGLKLSIDRKIRVISTALGLLELYTQVPIKGFFLLNTVIKILKIHNRSEENQLFSSKKCSPTAFPFHLKKHIPVHGVCCIQYACEAQHNKPPRLITFS